jgi:hypothetical protein
VGVAVRVEVLKGAGESVPLRDSPASVAGADNAATRLDAGVPRGSTLSEAERVQAESTSSKSAESRAIPRRIM